MKVMIFDTHSYDREQLCLANQIFKHDLNFYEGRLTEKSVSIAAGFPAICAFVNDHLNREVLSTLKQNGTKLIALRSAGYNHIDLKAAKELGIKVVRVPEYSPYAVAEHAVALLLTLNRKLHKAFNRVREGNFSLDGLVGFDLHQKNVGVIGTGKIGKVFIQIMLGFGCKVLAYDPKPDETLATLGVTYVTLDDIFMQSDVVSLHCPLFPETKHLINEKTLGMMKPGSILINTSRGKLIETRAMISSLKNGQLGGAGLDVYEEEEHYFFNDHSGEVVSDDVLARLMTFPNVLLTSHQGFLTKEALSNIAQVTLTSLADFEAGIPLKNEVL
jgi:D-lactate dehydrogenase